MRLLFKKLNVHVKEYKEGIEGLIDELKGYEEMALKYNDANVYYNLNKIVKELEEI